jgi:hypothetical protein
MVELVNWEDLKQDCQYDADDDNGGYAYGLNIIDDEGQIVDVMWFKTEQEREQAFNE